MNEVESAPAKPSASALARLERRRMSAKFNRRQVFVLIFRNNRYHVYTSLVDRPTWPPSLQQVEKSFPLPEIITATAMRQSWTHADAEKADSQRDEGGGGTGDKKQVTRAQGEDPKHADTTQIRSD